MSEFNGQINVSRDLRQNKQTILGKRDLLDIIFIVVGVLVAGIITYIFGFLIKVVDESLAVVIGLIPLVVILSVGFRKKANMRYIFYLAMNLISNHSSMRNNKAKISDVLNINETIDNNIGNDKAIIVLKTKKDNIKEYIKKYISNDLISRVQLRMYKDRYIILLELNYSYKTFLDIYTDNEYKTIGINKNKKENFKEFLNRLREKLHYKLVTKKKYYHKYSKFINFELFNKDFIPKDLHIIVDDIKSNKIEYITINDEYINSLDIKNKKVQMLHLYNNEFYDRYIDEIKEYAEVVIYIILVNMDDIYISTFLILDKDTEIKTDGNIVINNLATEQGIAMSQTTYHMFNPYNNYRIYKGN